MTERYTPQIVEGVMNRVLYELGMLVWNTCQKPWGTAWDAPFTPLQCGQVSVTITKTNLLDTILEVVAFGASVGTFLDSKREFYYAYFSEDWDDHQFVDWAKLVLAEIKNGAATGQAARPSRFE